MIGAAAATLAAAILPGLVWLWLFRSGDWRDPEPWRLVMRTFLTGAALAVPTALLVALAPSGAARSILLTPVAEEAAKLLAVWIAVWRNPAFDEPVDGLVYAAAAAFGFATVEAIGYSLLAAFAPLELAVDAGSSALAAGMAMAVLRGLITGPAHALWSCVWGYPLGVMRTGGGPAWRWRLVAGFTIAVAGHAMFNALSMEQNPAALGGMVALVIGGLILVRLQFRRMTG